MLFCYNIDRLRATLILLHNNVVRKYCPSRGRFTEPRPVGGGNWTLNHIHTFLSTQGHGGSPRMSDLLNAGSHLRDSTNMKDDTHQAHTHTFQQGEYEMVIMAAKWYSGTFMGLTFSDICLSGEENSEKTSSRKPVPIGRTRARWVTGAHATACSTAVDNTIFPME